MNTYEFPYGPPAVASLTANLSRACFCVATSYGFMVRVHSFKTVKVFNAPSALKGPLEQFQVKTVLTSRDAIELVKSAKENTTLKIFPSVVEVNYKNVIADLQIIQNAYREETLVFDEKKDERMFTKRLRRIDPKEPSVEAEAMLLLVPSLLRQKRRHAPQVGLTNVYI